ncbi:MAG: metal ABC transporter permease [Actinomycetota bacterium]|nr:MAG: metal ABC transporter permease [Actinomycetota bacterium]
MRNAALGGALVAVSAGLLGYFVILRQSAFAAHALAHIGFPGATGAVLVGIPVTVGLLVCCVAGALAIGALGRQVRTREIATGTILAFATGLGVLFATLSSRSSGTVTSVLFGNLLAISTGQLVVFAGFTVLLLAALAVIARPLAFASLDPAVAQARGVPVRALGVAFLVMLALVITMAIQVVGTLLLFALVVTPSATALMLTARPVRVVAGGVGISLGSVLVGLALAAMFDLPPSFFVVTIATVIWLVTLVATRERRTPPPGAAADGHHHHRTEPELGATA